MADDENLNFLLSNVNEDPKKPKTVYSERLQEQESFNSERRESTFNYGTSNPSTDPNNNNNALTNSQSDSFLLDCLDITKTPKDEGPHLPFALGGVVLMGTLTVVLVLIGVLGNFEASVGIWMGCWLVLCVAAFWCTRRKPRALHLCFGACDSLTFGFFAMLAFAAAYDIDRRTTFNMKQPTTFPPKMPAGGDIVVFDFAQSAQVWVEFMGQGSAIENNRNYYYCVAPILPTNPNPNDQVVFWAGCEIETAELACDSQEFKDSECYEFWLRNEGAGFMWDHNVLPDLRKGVLASSQTHRFNITEENLNKVVVVEWVPNPHILGNYAFTLGWIILVLMGGIYFCCSYGFTVAGRSSEEYQRLL